LQELDVGFVEFWSQPPSPVFILMNMVLRFWLREYLKLGCLPVWLNSRFGFQTSLGLSSISYKLPLPPWLLMSVCLG